MKALHIFLRKLINFYLYSSLHIGLCAAAMVYQTCLISRSEIFTAYYAFVFSATILMYSCHRLIGIERSKNFKNIGRFATINRYKTHILLYAIVSGIATVITFFRFERDLQLILLIPVVLSMLYTFPVLSNRLRLRDIPFIKIFLIALVWCFITAFIPDYLWTGNLNSLVGINSLERFIFIFAITIPFDVRDRVVDSSENVTTLPMYLGVNRSVQLSCSLLLLCLGLYIYLFFVNDINSGLLAGLIIFYLLAILVVYKSKNFSHDYYFSGIIDGLMILCPLICTFSIRIWY